MLYYVHSNQKLEITHMSPGRGMDTENVVHLHSGVLLTYLKQWVYEILRQMDGSGVR
jgi:hypothetical protein